MPPPVRDADPRPGRFGQQAWAEPSTGASFLWCATFSGSTPHDPVAAFAASLASPHPVPRSCLPADVERSRSTSSAQAPGGRGGRADPSGAGQRAMPRLRDGFGKSSRQRPPLAAGSSRIDQSSGLPVQALSLSTVNRP
ncbi:DUF317 domain-containing protein [Streptomyces thermolilacinus]